MTPKRNIRERIQDHVGYLYAEMKQARLSLPEFTRLLDKFVIVAALQESNWNACLASRRLRVHRNTLTRHMHVHGIWRPHVECGPVFHCKCGREIKAQAVSSHMRTHIVQREVRIVLRTNPERFEYLWLQSEVA
jgi:hypothetical protein